MERRAGIFSSVAEDTRKKDSQSVTNGLFRNYRELVLQVIISMVVIVARRKGVAAAAEAARAVDICALFPDQFLAELLCLKR